jgi:hypothetical protein
VWVGRRILMTFAPFAQINLALICSALLALISAL